MGTDKEDTDPSSPGALRPSSRVVAAAARAQLDMPSAQPTTDPGLGPASAPPPASARRSMGVTVPAPSLRPAPGPSAITPPELTPIAAPVSATPSPNKDSVELLLEGMAGPRPDRRKTMPQSDGEASAAYHAEHGVHRARTSEPAGPKVVVDRPAPSPSRERAPSPGFGSGSVGSREALSTFVPARALRRRVAMAIVAGVLMVLLLLMGLRLSGPREAPAPTPSAEATAPPPETTAFPAETTASVPGAPSAAGPAAGATGETTASEPVPIPSTRSFDGPHGDDSHLVPAPHAQGGAAPTRHRRSPADAPASAPASSGPDLGEFKTKF